MADDGFVQMLMAAAGGEVTDARDIELARAAGRWALSSGRWAPHLHNSFFVPGEGMDRWVLVISATQRLEIRVRLGGGDWHQHASLPVANLGHGLDLLAAERLILPAFCPLGRRTLEDHAESLDRAAGELWRLAQMPGINTGEGEHYDWELKIRSATLNMAADRARAFPRGELAVLR